MNESSDSGPSSGPDSASPPGGDAEGDLRPGCEISLQNPNRYPGVKAAELRPWLDGVVAELAPAAATFAVLFCGDRAMRKTNRDYRGFDKTTDVLSFRGDLPPAAAAARWAKAAPPFSAGPASGGHLGDLLISVPQAARQAAELGHGLDAELRILLLHGILHCLGFDHEADDGTMNRLEAELRRRFVGELSFLEGSET
jgi:probable rRNA maturation factor